MPSALFFCFQQKILYNTLYLVPLGWFWGFFFLEKWWVFRSKTTHRPLLDNYRCNREQIIRIMDVMLHLNPTFILKNIIRSQLYQ